MSFLDVPVSSAGRAYQARHDETVSKRLIRESLLASCLRSHRVLIREHRFVNLSGDGVREGVGEMIAGRIWMECSWRMVRIRHRQEADYRLYHPAGFKAGVERRIPEEFREKPLPILFYELIFVVSVKPVLAQNAGKGKGLGKTFFRSSFRP
jgi:hypothetical protein